MTKYIDRNWEKWEQNIAPLLAAAADEEKSKNRRMTMKMYEEDPDEEQKQDSQGPFTQARDNSYAEQMFSGQLPPNQPPAYATQSQHRQTILQQQQ